MAQRTWFITGINSGFGRHMTEQLLERGDRVAGTVRNMNSVDDLKEKYGELLWVAQLDVTDTPAFMRSLIKLLTSWRRLTLLSVTQATACLAQQRN